MELDHLKENPGFPSIRLFAITFASSGALSWFFVITLHFDFLFQNITDNQLWIFLGLVLFYGFGALSAFVGVYVQRKISRKSTLFWSTTLGVLSTGALVAFQGDIFALIFGILLGTSFGIGFPSSAALFGDYAERKDRGKNAGILVLMTFVLISLEMIVAEVTGLGVVGIVFLMMLLRSTSYLSLTQDMRDTKKRSNEKSYVYIMTQRNFALYIAPWVLFNLVSGLANFIYPGLPVTSEYEMALEIGNVLQFVSLSAVSMISGVISDKFGRRLPVVIGVVTFGISFAMFGIATTPLSLIIQLTTHGIAWGFCMVAYFVIPADLSEAESYTMTPHIKEKFYATSTVLPFISYMATGTIPAILGTSVKANILSPILSILLFLSVVPILFAKETLPEEYRRERKMKAYVEKLARETQKE